MYSLFIVLLIMRLHDAVLLLNFHFVLINNLLRLHGVKSETMAGIILQPPDA